MWDPCCTLAPHVADCMYVVFICGTFVVLVSCIVPLFLHCGATVARCSCVAPPPYDCTCNEVFMITDVG
jgi:hypothetical protein